MIVDTTKLRKAIEIDKEKRGHLSDADMQRYGAMLFAIDTLEFYAPGWGAMVDPERIKPEN